MQSEVPILHGTMSLAANSTPTRQTSLSLHVVFPQHISCEDKAITESSLCYLHVYDGFYGPDISAVSTDTKQKRFYLASRTSERTNGIFPIDKRICRTTPRFPNHNKVILTAEIFYFHFSCSRPTFFGFALINVVRSRSKPVSSTYD